MSDFPHPGALNESSKPEFLSERSLFYFIISVSTLTAVAIQKLMLGFFLGKGKCRSETKENFHRKKSFQQALKNAHADFSKRAHATFKYSACCKSANCLPNLTRFTHTFQHLYLFIFFFIATASWAQQRLFHPTKMTLNWTKTHRSSASSSFPSPGTALFRANPLLWNIAAPT